MPQLPDYFLSPNIHGLKVPKLTHLWDKGGLPVSGIPVLVHVYFWHCNNSLKKFIFKITSYCMKQTNNTASLPMKFMTFIKPFGQSRKLNKVLLKD
jgi:hypothetical protein